MKGETPRETLDLVSLSILFHPIREQFMIFPDYLAELTETSEAYWEELRAKGTGPTHYTDDHQHYYLLGDVQSWLLDNGFLDAEARNE
jgi:hypothetical protein